MPARIRFLVLFASSLSLSGCLLDRSGLLGADAAVDAAVPRDATPLVDGGEAEPDAEPASDAGPCSVDSAVCVGNTAMRCTGGAPSREDCSFGCDLGRCLPFVPSNVQSRLAMDAGTGAVVVEAGEVYRFRTDNGEILRESGGTIRAAGEGLDTSTGVFFSLLPPVSTSGAPLGVFVMGSLTVPADAQIRVGGDRALVLLVGGDADVSGTIDGSANGPSGIGGGGNGGDDGVVGLGPGGGNPGTDLSGRADSGGGGGSHASAGGSGGDSSAVSAAHGTETCEPLSAGSGGGGGGGDEAGSGGGGGAAVQISCVGTLRVSGTIDVGGGGGVGGNGSGLFEGLDSGAGGGGGAGGSILLEARSAMLTGVLAANGGGGGQGSRCQGGVGCSFDDGERGGNGGTAPPASGSSNDRSGGGGGAGSDGGGGNGQPGGSEENGGGGGGGAGRIRVNTADGLGALTRATITGTRSEGGLRP